jgi:hypothetical protein
MRHVRRHVSFANVISVIALFVALGGGTAVALTGSDTVQSDDLGPGSQVKAPDVAANAVNGSDVVDGSITGADISPSALSKGRSTSTTCDPGNSTYADCGHVSINLARPARVLIVTSAMWYGNSGSGQPDAAGSCRMELDGAPVGPNASPGEVGQNSTVNAEQSLSLNTVTDQLSAGAHIFGLGCNQFTGDIIFDPTYVSAVSLGSG